MTRWFLLALVLLLAAAWSATHPPQRWNFYPAPAQVDPDELTKLNPV